MTTPLKAIKAKCMECSAGSKMEVKNCPVTDCALYLFRFGKGKPKNITDSQRNALKQQAKLNFKK